MTAAEGTVRQPLDPAAADTAAVLRHLEWMRQRAMAPGTVKRRRSALEHLRAVLGISLLAAKRPMILEWRMNLRRTPSGVEEYLGHARAFYAWAVIEGLVSVNPVPHRPGLDQADLPLVSQHLQWMRLRGLSPRTIEHRRRALARLGAWLPCLLLEADKATLMEWRTSLHLAPKTIASYVNNARQFYAWAAENGLIDTSPATGIPVPKRPAMLPRPISEQDLMTALDSAPPPIRLWLVLAGWAGLRAQEIAWLRRESIRDRADPPVLLVTSDSAKGGRERIVPLAPFVLAELAAARLPGRGWVFLRQDGQPGPNQPSRISHRANQCLHEAGIPATIHQLRHRFGTQLYRHTHDLRLVQDLLGHADLSTTAGYAAWDREGGPGAVTALPAPGPRH